ncbi:cellulase [Mycena floridula]|nr:cellulase [Mycena floridula]
MLTAQVFSILFSFVFLCPTLAEVPPWVGPLSTRGRWIVDTNGNRFKLKSGNFYGASGTYSGSGDINIDSSHHGNENSHTMPLGLQYVSLADMLASFDQLRINSVRLPFSNEMIHDATPVQDAWVAANPQFRGLTPLQVYDEVIKALTAAGIAVILNNHTNKSKWCCGVGDGNERWNESQSDDAWVADWLFMVSRYRDNKRVVGADLYNEVRRDILNDPNWGSGDAHDWFSASQRVATRIHLEANPDILIIVEGINWAGIPVDGLYHHRPTLEPVRTLSHTLVSSNKLIYSAHFYSYTGPNHSGATGIGETSDPRYRDLSRDDLFSTMTEEAGYVAFDTQTHYVAPVWISEFGINRGSVPANDQAWFINMVDYLVDNDLDFAFWPLTGYLGPSWTDGWALLNWDPSTGRRDGLYDGNDWRADTWDRLVDSGATGFVPNVTTWKMLAMDFGDFVQSRVQQSRGDWDPGAKKASCPDDLRLVGLSRGSDRGLCTDSVLGNDLWAAGQPTTVVKDESFVSDDWAGGYTKFQCPPSYYVIGWSIRGSQVSSALCAQAAHPLGTGGTGTKWFDQGDNRPGDLGGEFDSGQYKGVCEADEYMAGIAFTTRIFSSGNPAAILCRK